MNSEEETVLHSIGSTRMARLLENIGFVVQHLRGDDGSAAVRFMKLGIDGMVRFFGPADDDQFRVAVLNAYLVGAQPLEGINAINCRGILPKIYATKDNTVVELAIPIEAGLTIGAVAYYVKAFEDVLKNVVTPAPAARR